MRLEILKSNHHCFFTDIDQITCFSNSIMDDTVSKCEFLFSVDEIIEKVSQSGSLKMASAQVVETSATNDSPSQDSNHPDDLFQSNVTPGFKPFCYWNYSYTKRYILSLAFLPC